MSYQLQEINRRIDQDVNGFLEECDAQYAEKVSQAADAILANLPLSPIVLLSGPSGSGKTTTALKIEEELERAGGPVPHHLPGQLLQNPQPQDRPPAPPMGPSTLSPPSAWTWTCSTPTSPSSPRGRPSWCPHFEFARQMRNDQMGTPLRLGKNEVAIFEGIHALNDDCAGRNPAAMCLYISARSDVLEGEDLRFKGTWMRLTRRAVRDYNFRGTGVAETLDMWANVRRGEKLYISPYKHRANYIFDSSLPYEVSVMKNYAKPMLEAVPEENARRSELLDLIHGFDHFLPIDPDLCPRPPSSGSLLGGGIYEYKVTSGTRCAGLPRLGDCGRNRASGAGTLLPRRNFSAGGAGGKMIGIWFRRLPGRRKCDSLRAGLRRLLACIAPAGAYLRGFCDKPWALAHLNTQ